MSQRLKIESISKLRVSNICGGRIHLWYEDAMYTIKPKNGVLVLYRKYHGNKYEEMAKSRSNLAYTGMLLKVNNITPYPYERVEYAHIDMEYFVLMCTYAGLFDSIYSEMADKYFKRIKQLRTEAKELEDTAAKYRRTADDLETELLEMSEAVRHNRKESLRVEVANRNTGFAIGEMCEELRLPYGHEDGSGILIDLRNLPVGSFVHILNGGYDTVICMNKHLKKCLGIVGSGELIELTDEHNAGYVGKKEWDRWRERGLK